MIDADEIKHWQRDAVTQFLTEVYRGLSIERRYSTLVRATVNGARLDFRITYVGPSRPRKSRRPSMTAKKQGA